MKTNIVDALNEVEVVSDKKRARELTEWFNAAMSGEIADQKYQIYG
jgi:hypothetical protein